VNNPSDCPSKECHDRVDRYGRTIYGDDGIGGIVGAISRIDTALERFVTKKFAWSLFISLMGVITLSVIFFANIWSDTRLITDLRQNADSREKRLIRVEEQVSNIRYTQSALLNKLNDMAKQRQDDMGKIFKSLSEIKHGERLH